MTRILSLALPTLPIDRLGFAADAAAPRVTVAAVKGAQRIAAVDNHAQARAIRPGMGLADARAVCPALRVTEADPHGEARTLEALLDWCRRFTPLAALDPPDGLLLDITGAAHLFGGEAGLVGAVEAGLARQGFAATAAIADTPEAAWALARFGDRPIVPPGTAAVRRWAEALPLAALRLDEAIVQGLAQAGLRRIRDVLIRPRAPIAARFGQTMFARLDGLLGLVHTPISPSLAVPAFSAERRTLAGLTRLDAIEHALGILAERLCDQLVRADKGARRIEAAFFRVDGVVKRIAIGTSRPSRDPAGLMRLFRDKLDGLGENGLDTGYGFDLIRLSAGVVEPFDTRQSTLDPGSEIDRAQDFALLIDRLGARLGVNRVVRLRDVDHHVPEQAVRGIPAFHGAMAIADKGEDLDRPLRLFDRPEPIETVAGVPDGPPVQFRWRRAVHTVAAIEGPERIAAPWWTDTTPTRDYFQAEDRDGHRFWLFREGFYGTDLTRPRWFLHGLFG